MSDNNESFDFVKTEEATLNFWETQKIFQKTLEKTQGQKPYIFYDGPPFATGLPHHGHLVASTLKDIIPRYFTMKGRYVSRRFGWDCHGLPIEQEIDKKFQMSANDYVTRHGVADYNQQCRGIVQRYTKEWQKTVNRIGRWVDFENDYKTMDLNFMESVWWVFHEIWKKNLIYKGNKVIPYSTALQTGLSNFEATSNYQDVQDPAITVLFKLDEGDHFIAAWTTTPWTLPSNLALCVNKEIDYSLVVDPETKQTFYLAASRLEAYKKRNLQVLETIKGAELVGRGYRPLFPYFAELKNKGCFKILEDDYVSTSDGTGIVHLAPAFGDEDNRVMKNAGIIEIVCPIDEQGHFTKEIIDYQGLYIKEADKLIIKDLKSNGQLLVQSTLVHSYPFCPRTDTPLIYRTMPQWYLAVEKIKEQIIAANQQINWVPDHIKDGRFGKWLEGAKDWAISRNRYWGTPLPIWYNEACDEYYCVGSIVELENLTKTKITDLHRESVDNLSFSLDGKEGIFKRIPEVLDCWFESGSMPYAQLHYPFENQEVFNEGFPAEYIAEGLDQTRGWFYTLTVLSSALFNKPAFKNVIVNGLVLASDGKKMSKRLKNYTAPDELMNRYGADALRLFLINSGLVKGEELRFSDEGVKDMVRRALLPWYNSFKFFKTYAEIDGWTIKESHPSENITDRWIISKLQTLIDNVNHEMENYRLYNVVPALFSFIEDLTNWYIRLNRRRFWQDGLTNDKKSAYHALYITLKDLCILMAPFAPFLSEHIYRELAIFCPSLKESVHLEDYPEANKSAVRRELEDAVDRMQQIILLGRQKRSQENIKVKMPLASITIIHRDQKILDEIAKLETYIQSELNIKKLLFSTEEDNFINLYAKPNSPILGKKLGKNFSKYRQLIETLDQQECQKIENGGIVQIHGQEFSGDEILIFRDAKPGTHTLSNRLISIELNCSLSSDLIEEGLAREIVSNIQKSRKDAGFEVNDRIQILFHGDSILKNALLKHKNYISAETLAISIEEDHQFINLPTYELEIEGKPLKLGLKRV